jgi:hypothetical protein
MFTSDVALAQELVGDVDEMSLLAELESHFTTVPPSHIFAIVLEVARRKSDSSL